MLTDFTINVKFKDHVKKLLEYKRKLYIEINTAFYYDYDCRLADELDSHSQGALENPDFYLGNPVNAYLFVKRFTIDWEEHVEGILKWKPNEGN